MLGYINPISYYVINAKTFTFSNGQLIYILPMNDNYTKFPKSTKINEETNTIQLTQGIKNFELQKGKTEDLVS